MERVERLVEEILYVVEMGQRERLDSLVKELVKLKGRGTFEVPIDGKRYVVTIEEVKTGLEAAFAAIFARQYGVASNSESGVNSGVAVAPIPGGGMYVHVWYSRELLD